MVQGLFLKQSLDKYTYTQRTLMGSFLFAKLKEQHGGKKEGDTP